MMQYNLNLTPFNDYSINCYFNNIMSIIITREPSYRAAAYVNKYTYVYRDIGGYFSFGVNYLRDFADRDKYIQWEYHNFPEKRHCQEDIQQILLGNRIIFVGVDLFYWVDNTIAWQNHHWPHYAMIVGFDTDKNEYYTYEEDFTDYRQHTIPGDRFMQAVMCCTYEKQSFIVESPGIEAPFVLLPRVICTEAERIIKELGAVDTARLWSIKDRNPQILEILGNFYIGSSRIRHRQTGNKLLIQALYDAHFIDKAQCTRFTGQAEVLINGWLIIMNTFSRCMKTAQLESKLPFLQEKAKSIMQTEAVFWEELAGILTAI